MPCRIQQLFMEFLSNSRQLRWLSCSFMVGLVTPCSLACLSNPSAETLQHLSLVDHQLGGWDLFVNTVQKSNCFVSIKTSDTSAEFFPGPLISPTELDRLSHLHSLALDFSDLTSDLCGLLASPRRTPLHRLSLLLNGAALEFKPLEGTATEDDWKALVRQHLFLFPSQMFPCHPLLLFDMRMWIFLLLPMKRQLGSHMLPLVVLPLTLSSY